MFQGCLGLVAGDLTVRPSRQAPSRGCVDLTALTAGVYNIVAFLRAAVTAYAKFT